MKKPLLYATLVALLGFWACQKDSLTSVIGDEALTAGISERGDSTQVDSCGGHGHHHHLFDSTFVHVPHDSTWTGGHHGHDSIPHHPHDSTWVGGGHPSHDSIPHPPHDSTGHPGGGHGGNGGGHGGGGGHHGGGH